VCATRFLTARNVPLSDGTNSIQAATSATTLAGNSPTSDTVTDVALDTSLNVAYTYRMPGVRGTPAMLRMPKAT